MGRLPDWDDVPRRNTQCLCCLKALLSDVRYNDASAYIDDDLQGIEAKASETEEKDQFVLFHFSPLVDRMIRGGDGVSCDCGFGRAHT